MKALLFYRYLKEDPERSHLNVSRQFGVSRARVSQLIRLVERLPDNLIEKMQDTNDQDLLKVFSGKRLLRIANLKSSQERQQETDKLLAPSK